MLFDANLVASYDRMIDADCDVDCDLSCSTAVSDSGRREAYDRFRGLADARVAQNLYLCTCIEIKQRTVDTDDHIIEQTTEFWLGDRIKIKVCKTFFGRALGLPDARLDALLEPDTFEWYSKYKRNGNDDNTDDVVADAADRHDEPNHRPSGYRETEQTCSDFVFRSRYNDTIRFLFIIILL